MDLKKFQRLKEKAEALRTEAEQAKGALNQLMTKLNEEYDCQSIEDAEKLLEKYEKEVKKAEEDYDKELISFEEEWGEKLGHRGEI